MPRLRWFLLGVMLLLMTGAFGAVAGSAQQGGAQAAADDSSLAAYVGRLEGASFGRPDQTKPRQLHPFSADDNAYFFGLSWSEWGDSEAHADGKAAANDCDPNCAAGTFVRAKGAHATLYRLREGSCNGDRARFYTRAKLEWPRRLQLPTTTVKLRMGCQPGG